MTSKTTTAGIGGLYTMHSLRYSYAQDLKKTFAAEGYSDKEVKAMVSMSLGHGDGRGKFVDRVYAQKSEVPPTLNLPVSNP